MTTHAFAVAILPFELFSQEIFPHSIVSDLMILRMTCTLFNTYYKEYIWQHYISDRQRYNSGALSRYRRVPNPEQRLTPVAIPAGYHLLHYCIANNYVAVVRDLYCFPDGRVYDGRFDLLLPRIIIELVITDATEILECFFDYYASRISLPRPFMDVVRHAIRKSNLRAVKFLHRIGVPLTSPMLQDAFASSAFNIAEYLLRQGVRCANGCLAMMPWNMPCCVSLFAYVLGELRGQDNVTQSLNLGKAFALALINDNFEFVWWAVEEDAFDLANTRYATAAGLFTARIHTRVVKSSDGRFICDDRLRLDACPWSRLTETFLQSSCGLWATSRGLCSPLWSKFSRDDLAASIVSKDDPRVLDIYEDVVRRNMYPRVHCQILRLATSVRATNCLNMLIGPNASLHRPLQPDLIVQLAHERMWEYFFALYDPVVPLSEELGNLALAEENIAVLEWFCQHECFPSESIEDMIVSPLCSNEHLECLYRYQFPFPSNLYNIAARLGNADLMQWLYEHDVPFDSFAFNILLKSRQTDLALWCIEHNFPSTESHSLFAYQLGNFQVLEALVARGAPVSSHLCEEACRKGELELLMWAKAHGIECSKRCLDIAERSGRYHVVEWLLESETR